MLSRVKFIRDRVIKWAEDTWVKHDQLVFLFLSLVTVFFYWIHVIANFRANFPNIVLFAATITGILGVFLTLVIALQESPAFVRLKKYFPDKNKEIYGRLQKQLAYSMAVIVFSILAQSVVLPIPFFINSLALGVLSYLFWQMSIGSFYLIVVLISLVTRNFEIPQKTIMK